jgi:hypothetical protein
MKQLQILFRATRGLADAQSKAEMHAIKHPHPTTLRCDQPSRESLTYLQTIRNDRIEEGQEQVQMK